ncbi:MAG: redoxin domain-containing protein [candidate division WOR-3 bacterium]
MSTLLGRKAPIFTLKDHKGDDFSLKDLKGKKILLSFHPLAWTKVCADQMKSLEKNYDKFLSLNIVPVGINVDPLPSKKAWAKVLGIKKLRLLSDFWPHGAVAKRYRIFRQADGFSERANILIDEKGKVIFFKVYPIPEVPSVAEILDFVKKGG